MFTQLGLLTRVATQSMLNVTFRATFAAPVKAVGGQAIGKKRFRLPVEQDLPKLMANCCGANYAKEGTEIPLKDDAEYPEWLWKLPTKPPRHYELDPNTKEYWEKAEIVGQQREWKLKSITNVSLGWLVLREGLETQRHRLFSFPEKDHGGR